MIKYFIEVISLQKLPRLTVEESGKTSPEPSTSYLFSITNKCDRTICSLDISRIRQMNHIGVFIKKTKGKWFSIISVEVN